MALNWQEDSAVKIQKVIFRPLTRIVRLVFIITLTLHDIGFAIYVRYRLKNTFIKYPKGSFVPY
jgi:hypothetical protein